MNFLTATVNHLCHRVFPYLIIGFLLFKTLGLTSWVSYAIVALTIFIQKYNYKLGYYACLMQAPLLSTLLTKNEKKPEMEE